MPEIGDKKKFKGKKLKGLKYLESEYMGEDLGWVDSFRDVKGERALEAFYRARADYEERLFKFKLMGSKKIFK